MADSIIESKLVLDDILSEMATRREINAEQNNVIKRLVVVVMKSMESIGYMNRKLRI